MRFQNFIEAHLPYKGYPVFKNSRECTNEEFDVIIPHMKDHKLAIVAQAKANQTPISKFLKEQDFNFRQTCNRINSWVSSCPKDSKYPIYGCYIKGLLELWLL
jgi:hypothetical protein